MRNFLSTAQRVIVALCAAGLTAMALEVLPVNVPSSPLTIDGQGDEPFWQNAPCISDTKEFRGDITMTLKAGYGLEKLWLFLDIRRPEPELGEPATELYLRPVIRGHRPKDLVRKAKHYFTIKFDRNGLISDDYDGAITLKTAPNGTAGFQVEMELDMPQTMEWLPQVPQPGDYYDISVFFRYPTIQRYSMYFFSNHRNETGPEMAKAILAGKQTITRPLVYFDNEVTYYEVRKTLVADLAELEKFDAVAQKAAADGRQRLQTWEKLNEELDDVDYQSRRFFQLRNLVRLQQEMHSARVSALTRLPQYVNHQALVFGLPCWQDDRRVNTFTLPKHNLLIDTVGRLRVAPGEIDSFSVGVWSAQELTELTYDVAPFVNASKVDGNATVERFYVKCWYQGAGYTELTQSRIELTPELLVRDFDLVTSDHLLKNNVLKVYQNGRAVRRYPDDATELRPIRYLPAESLQQLWIRYQFPEDTPAGTYVSKVTVKAGDVLLGEYPVKVEVLPFTLGKSPIRNQIYTLSRWGEQGDDIALMEIRNLARHGVDTVGLYEKADTLVHVVELMKQGGLSIERIYLQGDGDFYIWPDIDPVRLEGIVKAGLKAKEVSGVKDVYFYLPDEAMGEKLKKSIPIADVIHRMGGKTWGAASAGWINVPGAEGIFDHMNQSGPPPVDKELVTRMHKNGHELFCYNFPQGGMEAPQRYRRHFGILMYGSDYDGTMTWCWFWPYEGAEYDCWNEFNEHFWKQHCMVYPTQNGVVDTMQYEGWARGINDLRYLGKLLELRDLLPAEARLGREIDAFIGAIKKDPYETTKDQEKNRDTMVSLILRALKMTNR